MAGFDRSRINLTRRTQEQTDTRDDFGGISRPNYMNFSGVKLKYAKLGEVGSYHYWNILPWRIATKNHPGVVSGKYNIGDWDYILDVQVHTNIGAANGDYICLKKNLGKPCPICEAADRLKASDSAADKEAAKKLYTKRKAVYLIQEMNEDCSSKSDDPMIFKVAYPVFSQALQTRATTFLKGHGVVDFANPDTATGKVVSFTIAEGSMGQGKTFKKADSFDFEDRIEEISDATLEACPSLDKFMVIKTYDQLKAILNGDDEESEEEAYDGQDEEQTDDTDARDENPQPRGEQREASRRERTTGESSRREFVPDENPQPRRERTAERAPARFTDNEPPAEDRVEDLDLNQDAYTARRSKARKESVAHDVAPARQAAQDTATMPFDETTEEQPKAPSRDVADNECPNHKAFGTDCNKFNCCDSCPEAIYSKCLAAHTNMRKRG